MRKKIEEVSWFDILFYMGLVCMGLAGPVIHLYKKIGNPIVVFSISGWVVLLFTFLYIINLRVYRITKHLNEKIDEENNNEK